MPDSPYFIAVKAAHLSALVMERERCNVPVSQDDVRMFRIRAHEVATMAELAEGAPVEQLEGTRCGKRGCRLAGQERMCPYAAEVHGTELRCTCCAEHYIDCKEDV